uniref:Homing endonuclease LAGLIDADG domain-containing protein n=1 Tax=Panagrolaimus sp. JU765 TaxID=591449 RepID=A0AC34Q9W5_9BILA
MHDLIDEKYSTIPTKNTFVYYYYQIAEKLDTLDMALQGKNHLNSIDKKKREELVQFFSKDGQRIISNHGIPIVLDGFLNYVKDSEIKKYVEIIRRL